MLAPSINGDLPTSKSYDRSVRYRGWKFWNSLSLNDSVFIDMTREEKINMVIEKLIKKRSDVFVYY